MPAIVLVAYYYPPLGGVASQRALSFARYLPALGFDVVVVTPRRGAYGLDPTLPADDALPGVRVVRTGSFEPAVLARRLLRSRGSNPAGDMVDAMQPGRLGAWLRRALHAKVYFPDHARGWTGPASRAAARAAHEERAVAILSTSPPVSAHVAGVRAAHACGLPAVLDFRDLWTAQRNGGERGSRAAAEERLERDLLRDAAAVTTVSEAWRTWLRDRHGSDGAKPFSVLRNGFESADFADAAPPHDRDVFRLVHAGTIDGPRQDLRPFFRALAAVRTEGAFGAKRVEVVLAGKLDERTTQSARAAGCEDALRLPGFVSHRDAVLLLRTATVNLLLTWSEPAVIASGHCPGKMYEQIAAARPVLALAPTNCEAVAILERTGGALVADPQDELAIADALRSLAAADARGDALSAAPPRRCEGESFSRRSVAVELAALLASVAK